MVDRGAKLLLCRARRRPIRALNPTIVWSPVFPFVLAAAALGTFPKSSTAAAQGEKKEGRGEKRKVPTSGNRRPRCTCIPCSTPCRRAVLRPEVAAQHQEHRAIAAVDANQKSVEGEGRRWNRSCYVRKPH
jgi:hypothetical protein